MSRTFVIVGAGLAAAKAVEQLVNAGFDGTVVVFGSEGHPPYERPPLSKGYLLGADELESVFPHPASWYAEHGVELLLDSEVTAIDLAERTVTAGPVTRSWDRLLLATGASPRRLAIADDSGAPVAYLRTIEDSDRLREAFGPGRRVVVIGGGWIGLEAAAAAHNAGAEVTVLESAALPLLAVLGPEVATVFADLHREHGVDLRTEAQVVGVEAEGGRARVSLADGESVEADLVLVGIGAVPNVGLAETAGLLVDNGVLVNSRLETSVEGVFAAGDIANAEHPVLGRRLRVEHWDNAIEQGKLAARAMLGEDVEYDRMPYFFTDQYDLGMEYVGSVGPQGYDEVVLRGDVSSRVFTAYWISDGVVVAGLQVNDWDATDGIRELLGRRVEPSRLRDNSVALTDL